MSEALARYEHRRHVHTGVGEHRWSNWGPFVPIKPEWLVSGFADAPYTEPKFEPVEAYRWRQCECGAAERDSWNTRERKFFDREAVHD